LVNNAGIGGPQMPIGAYPLDGWAQVMNVNLNAAFYGMRYAIPAMRAAGGGSIIHMASQLGHVGREGRFWYCTAKAALVPARSCSRPASALFFMSKWSASGACPNAKSPWLIQMSVAATQRFILAALGLYWSTLVPPMAAP
jgi:hypothetical protein